MTAPIQGYGRSRGPVAAPTVAGYEANGIGWIADGILLVCSARAAESSTRPDRNGRTPLNPNGTQMRRLSALIS